MQCLTIIASNVLMDVIFIFNFDTDNCCKISLAFSVPALPETGLFTQKNYLCQHFIDTVVLTECFWGICDMTAELPCQYICTGYTPTRVEAIKFTMRIIIIKTEEKKIRDSPETEKICWKHHCHPWPIKEAKGRITRVDQWGHKKRRV